MKTAVIFVQKNLIDLSKESFTLNKIINQTGKEFLHILSITGCFVFFCCRVKVFYTVCFGLCAHELQNLQIKSMFRLHYI